MPKVSVVMPVYNAQKYLSRAFIGLMEQSLDDVEFLIIDDGSTDDSLEIIQGILSQYPNRKNQVVIISRENRGVAASRAEGVCNATGDYVIQHDSDDWADPDWLSLMYSTALTESADIVVCDYSIVTKRNTNSVIQNIKASGRECAKLLLSNEISNANWNKLIKLDFLRKFDVNYSQGIDMGEDFLFSFKAFFFAKKVSKVDVPLYYYNMCNESSLTRKYSEKSFEDIRKLVSITERFIIEHNCEAEFIRFVANFKCSVRASFIYFPNNTADVFYGIQLYPESNKYLFKSKRHWLLKIHLLLFYLKLTPVINLIFFARKSL
ncbi:glycosyltransferase family 2 protein [Aeromonas veronii]|uniref:glycosyltransferase family 2 protein n=1 Tax=Aeromonas veronii TaxID=654 RepID=UPI00226C768E|nr:glycosyltransferase family A protein [Aeromonas veronii]MCX9111806.1 glycosyltransferase family 2 protein [Aeromonas veronii]